ncbi:MAG TPA: EndoU domain-containing protein [Candidatus Babeliales bacterium]|nr:EndoU domain-containing protein [Candidatus Babeliales bacterium]
MMKFSSYFLMFFLSFTRCFGLTSQEVMQQTVTIDLYCVYIEKQYYAEGKIASPYCVLACVVTETVARQTYLQASPDGKVSSAPSLHIPPTTENLDLKNSVHSFLSNPSPEKDDGIHIQNGILKAVFGNFSVGIDVVGLGWFLLKKIQGFITNTRVEKEFVNQYNEWKEKDFQNDALQIIKRGNQDHDDNALLSQVDQEAILSEYHLYQFEGFRSYIKTFSHYEPFIEQLHKSVCDDNYAKKRWWKKFPGFFYETFPDVVQSLYEQAEDERADRKKREQEEEARRDEARQLLHAPMQERLRYYAEYMHECAEEYDFEVTCGRWDDDLQEERFILRSEAIIKAEKNSYCLSTKTYNVSPQLDSFLQGHNLNPDVFRQCEGSLIQQCFHQEIIMIVDQAAAISSKYEHLQDPSVIFFTDTVVDVASVSAEYNHAGHVKQALILIDCCWSFLDCSIGVAQGLCDGTYKVYDAAQDPFGTIFNMASNTGHLVKNGMWHAGRVLYELCDVLVACETDKGAAEKYFTQAAKNIGAVATALADKIQKVPLQTVAREGTAMVVDAFLTKKCLGALYTFYTTTHKQLIPVIQAIERTGEVPAIAGVAEIIVAEGAATTTQLFKQAADTVKVVGQAVGGVAGQITKVPSTYLARKVSYMLYKEKEILVLFLHFKDALKIGKEYTGVMGFKNVKITARALKHIFGVEITEKMKKTGIVDTIIQGFHHDLGNKMSHLIKNPIVDKVTGVVKGTLDCLGQTKRGKTLFPSSWSRSKVMKKIQESLLNPSEMPILDGNRWAYIGLTSDGIKIKTVFEKTGELVTAYPILRG